MTKKIHVFYHVDLDGKLSAFLIKFALQEGILKDISEKTIIFHNFNYGFNINIENYNKKDIVFFVDCCPDSETFNFLYKRVYRLIWIDHHDFNINENKNLHFVLDGERNIEKAACENTLLFILKNMIENVDKEIIKTLKKFSIVVKLVGAYDVWDLSYVNNDFDRWEKEVLSFNFCLKALNDFPEDNDNIWNFLIKDENIFVNINNLQKDGQLILSYVNKENFLLCESYGSAVEFEGYKFFILNKGLGGSYIFSNIRKKESYDGFITFIKSLKNNKIKLSFFSNKNNVDFTNIWKKYGGGGNSYVGGLWCNELNIINENNTKYLILK